VDITVHIGHEDNVISIHLPSKDGKAKIMEEGLPGLAGVILTEEVGALLCPDTVSLAKGGVAGAVSANDACSNSSLARKGKPDPASQY